MASAVLFERHPFERIGNRYEDSGTLYPAGILVVPASGIEAPGGPSAGRPFCTMNREFVLVAGRLFDSPGCTASANP